MGTSGSQVHHVEEAAAEPGEAASKPSASAPATTNLFICAVPPKRLPTANPHPNGITTPVGARLVAPLKNLLRIRVANGSMQGTQRSRDNRIVFTAGALEPLKERNFRLLWIGQAVSAAGDALVPVAFAFAALQVGHTASALGPGLAASAPPRGGGLAGRGEVADPLPRPLVVVASGSLRAGGGV